MNIAAGPHQAPRQRSGCLKLLGFGCLGFIVCLFIGAFIVYLNYRSLTSWMVEYRTEEYLNYSSMSEEHKSGIRDQRDRILLAFEEDRLPDAKLKEAAESLYNGPLFPGFVAILIESDLAPRAGLNQEELASLRTALSRMTAAVAEKKLDGVGYQKEIAILIDQRDPDTPRLKEEISKQDLLQLRDALEKRADELQVAPGLYQFDFNQNLELFVDDVLDEQEL